MKKNVTVKKKLKKIVLPTPEEDRRYHGAVLEEIRGHLEILREGGNLVDVRLGRIEGTLSVHGERLDHIEGKLDFHGERLDRMEAKLDANTEAIGSLSVNMEIVKQEIEIIKGGFRKKIDAEEFSALESRVLRLERVQGIRIPAVK